MTLYLLPNLLSEQSDPAWNFIPSLHDLILSLDGFFVENEKKARKYFKHFDFSQLRTKPMILFNQNHTQFSLNALEKGERWGIVVDAGLPCLADPGSTIVYEARKKGFAVHAIPGPSAIFLAIMLSGLDAQTFVFQGYFSRDNRIVRLPYLQIFIETPYNAKRRLKVLLNVLQDRDFLCLASDLTAPSQKVVTQRVIDWKRNVARGEFCGGPTIFLMKTI